jgi:DNA-binding transcriptional MerR regulator
VTQLRIKDVAERSGFTPTTLRYYEEIGIVPAPQRSESGYRIYDERVLERLAFIARAKQLGCSLEEISELTLAWDGGRCGPVQDRLRVLVNDKINSAQRQIAEFISLTADLQRAAR